MFKKILLLSMAISLFGVSVVSAAQVTEKFKTGHSQEELYDILNTTDQILNNGALAINSLTGSGTAESINIFGDALTKSGGNYFLAGKQITN